MWSTHPWWGVLKNFQWILRIKNIFTLILSWECYAVLVAQSCPTLCDPKDCNLPGSSFQWDSSDKNSGGGCHALLQGICPTQGSNPCLLRLLHWRHILYPLVINSQPHWVTMEHHTQGFPLTFVLRGVSYLWEGKVNSSLQGLQVLPLLQVLPSLLLRKCSSHTALSVPSGADLPPTSVHTEKLLSLIPSSQAQPC